MSNGRVVLQDDRQRNRFRSKKSGAGWGTGNDAKENSYSEIHIIKYHPKGSGKSCVKETLTQNISLESPLKNDSLFGLLLLYPNSSCSCIFFDIIPFESNSILLHPFGQRPILSKEINS